MIKKRSDPVVRCFAFLRRDVCSDEEDEGDKMKDAGEIDEEMPDKMEIRMLWLCVEDDADRVHDTAQDDEYEERHTGSG